MDVSNLKKKTVGDFTVKKRKIGKGSLFKLKIDLVKFKCCKKW